MKNADGTQDEKRLLQDDKGGTAPNDWSRDGKYILYSTGSELWLVTVPELTVNSRRMGNGWRMRRMKRGNGRFL